MNRDLLKSEIFKLTTEEASAKSGDMEETFSDYLTEQGFIDEKGYFYLPSDFIHPFIETGENNIWNKMLLSPHQQLFGLRRSIRYVNEPFFHGEFIAIRYVYSGEVEIVTPGNSFVLHKNDMFLMNAEHVLKQRLLHDEDVAFTLIIEKEYLIKNILQDLAGGNVVSNFIASYITDSQNPEHYIIFHGDDNDKLPRIIEDILLEYIEPTEYGDLLLRNYLHILFIQMLYSRIECTKNSQSFRDMRFAQMIDYIRKNYITVTLDELSDRFGYNSKYISRKIKEHTGLNFKDYIIDKKLEYARVLLSTKAYSVTDVISAAGFSNATFFYQKFKEKYHMTPAEYRRQNT